MDGPAEGESAGPQPWPVLPAAAPLGFAVLDVETTGFEEHDRVVQVAITQVAPDGRVQAEWATLVDPLRNPGPVHIHGITPERLIGAPAFPAVAAQVEQLLTGRVLVAHNADFDYRMLHTELTRARVPDPVRWRLCTIRLARRVGVPVGSFSLAALAAHFGLHNPGAHDARHDTWTTVQLLRLLLARATEGGLPLTVCGGAAEWAGPRRVASRSAGFGPVARWAPGHPLVQGTRVLVVGPTRASRHLLRERVLEAGISWTTRLEQAGVVVCEHPDAATVRLAAVRDSGVPVVDEDTFGALLGQVLAGTPVPQAPPGPASRPPAPAPAWVEPGRPHPLPADADLVRLVFSWPLATGPDLLVRVALEYPDGSLPGPQDRLTMDHPVGDDGAVTLAARTLGEAAVRVALADLAPGYGRVSVTAERVDAGPMTGVGAVSVRVRGRQLRWDTEVWPAGVGPVTLARVARGGGRWRFLPGPG